MTPKTYWSLTALVFSVLLVPTLVQQGMFLDGVSYACIARNMAIGLGDFSHPHYTATLYPVCYEQPPLVFGVQSLFFRVFGEHFWVERLYCFCMAVLAAVGLVLNHRLIQHTHGGKDTDWLPVLLWISAPITFWSFANNMLECTMLVFVLFSSYFAVNAVIKNHFGWLAIATLLTAAAVLCKGPVGFFPVMSPVFAALFLKKGTLFNGISKSFLMLLGTFVFLTLLVFALPGMQEYLDYYLHKQLLPTLSGEREKQVENPFALLGDLASQLAIPCVLLLFFLARNKFKGISFNKPASYFMALGLVGSLPLMLSPKQSTHYLVPSIPYFALGFASILGQSFTRFKPSRTGNGRVLEKVVGGLFLVVVVVSCSFWGKYRRDEVLIRDITSICEQVGSGATLGVPAHFSNQWLLHAYFGRLGDVSLDARNEHEFWLVDKGGAVPQGFKEVWIGTNQLSLWQKQ